MDISFINRTEFEDDPFAEVQDNSLVAEYDKDHLAFYIVTALLKLATCLISISADLFLIVVICRFERLRSVRINKYILNLAVLNIIYHLCAPLYFIFLHLVFKRYVPTISLLQTQSTVLILYITFAIGLAVDGFLSSYDGVLMNRYKLYCNYVFPGIYVVFVIEWIFAFIYAENHHITRMSIFSVFYVTFFVLLVCLNILKCRSSMHNNSKTTGHALAAANVIYFAFFPLLIYHLMVQYISNAVVLYYILYTEFILSLIVMGHPVLVVYVLGKTNKYFKMAYDKSFNRSIRNYGVEDNLDGVSEDGRDTRNNKIEVVVTDEQKTDTHILEI